MTAELSQADWDAKWQRLYDQGRERGLAPNAAIHRADRVMDQWGHGERPNEETTK